MGFRRLEGQLLSTYVLSYNPGKMTRNPDVLYYSDAVGEDGEDWNEESNARLALTSVLRHSARLDQF